MFEALTDFINRKILRTSRARINAGHDLIL